MGLAYSLKDTRILLYDQVVAAPGQFSELSRRMHQAARWEDAAESRRFDMEIGHQTAHLWELIDAELEGDPRSLREMSQ